MSNAVRGVALPSDSEATVDAITRAYVTAAGGDPLAAVRLAVADALYTLVEMHRRARQVESLVSRGFTRGAFQRSDPA
jgi:hypothetical protein